MMIRLFYGTNSFELERALGEVIRAYGGEVQKLDGEELEPSSLPDVFMGQTLFSDKRLMVIRGAAANTALWTAVGDYLENAADTNDVIFVESGVDKRTRTYKQLQKLGGVQEFSAWSDRDLPKVRAWVAEEAARRGMALSPKLAGLLVERAGTDAWQLHFALEKLAVFDVIDERVMRDVIDEEPNAQAFGLFEAALRGDRAKVYDTVASLRLREDAYRTFGLLTGQVVQLAALIYGSDENVAADLGVHPYAVSKLRSLAQKLTPGDAGRIIKLFARADDHMKSSGADPWRIVEQTLLQTADDHK